MVSGSLCMHACSRTNIPFTLIMHSMFRGFAYLLIFCAFCFVVKMARQEFVFEVHYGGHIDRWFMNTYVGGDIDVYKEAIEHDRLSFSVVEGIAKSYGSKSGDLIYYLLPGCTLRNGLKLITSNFDVREMV
jgi:hypothetical protein